MNEELWKKVLLILGIFFTALFTLTPFVYMIIVSFAESVDFLGRRTSLVFTFKNYLELLRNPNLHFLDYLRNSAVVSGVSSFLTVLIASFAAYSITRLPFPGKSFFLMFVLAFSMFPQVSIVGFLFNLMSKLGLVNTYVGLILPYTAWIMPLSLWILVSYFSGIPKEIDKQATIDGCTVWETLFKVMWPLARPGIFTTFILAFIFAFNEFMFALLLTTDFRARTVPVGIALFQGLHGEIPWGTIMAASTLTTLPIVILVIVFQKNIIQGLTRGAVKG
ncbi:MAG: carbohydrate ABC transporter permease [bacterium]|nr:carbohydrate ABC transporter permease [bacterium]